LRIVCRAGDRESARKRKDRGHRQGKQAAAIDVGELIAHPFAPISRTSGFDTNPIARLSDTRSDHDEGHLIGLIPLGLKQESERCGKPLLWI
jgi:hypothetical protein